jgi:phosphonate degradation associated HDIG domain protein
MSIVGEIVGLFERLGDETYGEGVTQLAHALQSAWLAEREGASAAEVAAALLHDIGHLLHSAGTDAAERGIDTRHEEAGARWLADAFGPEVSEPVRLHVSAKRYLCAVRPGYAQSLSAASQLSLTLQGGVMGAREVAEFEAGPYWESAVRLRLWDDEAKVVGLHTPPLSHFVPFVAAVVVRRPGA